MNPLLWILWKFRGVRQGIAALLFAMDIKSYREGIDEGLITFEDFNL